MLIATVLYLYINYGRLTFYEIKFCYLKSLTMFPFVQDICSHLCPLIFYSFHYICPVPFQLNLLLNVLLLLLYWWHIWISRYLSLVYFWIFLLYQANLPKSLINSNSFLLLKACEDFRYIFISSEKYIVLLLFNVNVSYLIFFFFDLLRQWWISTAIRTYLSGSWS